MTGVSRVVKAGAVAALLSGVPSTVHALLTGQDVLAATRAAGTLAPSGRSDVLTGAAVHLVVSAGWTVVLAAVNRRRRLGVLGGAVAGLVIAAVDLELIGRHHPAIRELPKAPQWLDHLAFGAIAGGML